MRMRTTRPAAWRMALAGILLLMALLCAAAPAARAAETAGTGTWVQDSKGWWWKENGGYPANAWRKISGKWYWFGVDGYMATGWQQIGKDWYYLSGSGAMCTGWQQVGRTWYYLSGSGVMQTGWQKIGKSWYYLSGSGAMQTGWQQIGKDWYYLSGSGAMCTGWQQVGKTWYYLSGSGVMQTGWQKIGGVWYYLKPSGAMATGWQQVGTDWYYLSGSGAMRSSCWVGNYWLKSSGAMARSEWVDGGRYYVGDDGLWVSGAKSQALAAPSVTGALRVDGTRLVGEDGRAVQLRGVSTHGLAWFPGYVNAACFQELRQDWGANVVRLAMYTSEYGGYCSGGSKEALKKQIRDGVRYAKEADLYVIIDWHILSDGNPNTYKQEAKAFFQEMSAEFAGVKNVIYEICNEPNGGTSWKEVKSYAEEIIGTIRKNDAGAVILVGTPNWCQYVDQAAADPIKGYKNIMYTLHFYAATHKEDLRGRMEAAVKSGLPLFVSEYGVCDASGNGSLDLSQADQWVERMNQYGISYVCWSLCNKAESASILKSSCTKTSGFTQNDLSAAGKWLYQMLHTAAQAEGQSGGSGSGGSGSNTGSGGNAESGGNAGSGNTGSGGSAGSGNTGSSGSGNTGTGGGNTGSSGSTGGGGNTGSGSSGSVTLRQGELELVLTLKNSWESGGKTSYQYDMTIYNKGGSALDGWTVTVPFAGTISLDSGWNGSYQVSGNSLTVTSMDYNGRIPSGGSVSDVGFIVTGSGEIDPS